MKSPKPGDDKRLSDLGRPTTEGYRGRGHPCQRERNLGGACQADSTAYAKSLRSRLEKKRAHLKVESCGCFGGHSEAVKPETQIASISDDTEKLL